MTTAPVYDTLDEALAAMRGTTQALMKVACRCGAQAFVRIEGMRAADVDSAVEAALSARGWSHVGSRSQCPTCAPRTIQ